MEVAANALLSYQIVNDAPLLSLVLVRLESSELYVLLFKVQVHLLLIRKRSEFFSKIFDFLIKFAFSHYFVGAIRMVGFRTDFLAGEVFQRWNILKNFLFKQVSNQFRSECHLRFSLAL